MKIEAQNPPHIRSRDTNATLMFDTVVALVPLYAMAVYFYGIRALALGIVGVLTSCISDMLCCIAKHSVPNLRDLSAVVTGMIIPLLMPASIRYSIVIVAVLFAILVAKQPFGGVGENLFNPAAAGMAFAIVCWPSEVLTYPMPFEKIPLVLSSSTVIRTGTSIAKALSLRGIPNNTLLDTLMGNVPGPMGATNILVLLTCLLYLAVRRTIHIKAALSCIAGAAVTAILFPRAAWPGALYELMGGMLLFAAVFMINDPVTSPKHTVPMMIYAAMTGVLVIVFRHLGSYEESVVFAILVMNSVVWPLDLFGERLARIERRKLHEARRSQEISQETESDLGDI